MATQDLLGRTQNFSLLSFIEKILSLLGILARYRVDTPNKHDGRLLYKVLKC